MEEITTKTCKQCNIEKPITDFIQIKDPEMVIG